MGKLAGDPACSLNALQGAWKVNRESQSSFSHLSRNFCLLSSGHSRAQFSILPKNAWKKLLQALPAAGVIFRKLTTHAWRKKHFCDEMSYKEHEFQLS